MTQREKLIELLEKSMRYADENYGSRPKEGLFCGLMADNLLANGVIVPPCKVGQSVFLVYTPKFPANPDDKGKWFMRQDGIQRIIYGAKGLSIETWNMGTIP